jgi:MFS family permease
MRNEGHATGFGGLLALSPAAFGVFGVWSGLSAVLLADLSWALGLSPGPLGVALFAGAVASLAVMATLGWTVDQMGRKVFLVAVTCILRVEVLGLAGSFWSLVLVLVLFSPAGGFHDVGINAVAVDLERLSGRRFMSVLHASYSAGAVVGAIGSGAILSAVVGGFLMVGLAISGMAPLAYSLAGDLVPTGAGSAVSVVTAASFGGLHSPPAVGGVADLAGLRVALGIVVAAGLAVCVLSLRLREKT